MRQAPRHLRIQRLTYELDSRIPDDETILKVEFDSVGAGFFIRLDTSASMTGPAHAPTAYAEFDPADLVDLAAWCAERCRELDAQADGETTPAAACDRCDDPTACHPDCPHRHLPNAKNQGAGEPTPDLEGSR